MTTAKTNRQYNFLGKITRKEVMPKIYALHFEDNDEETLHIVIAYSLEEAIGKVKDKKDSLPSMWESMEVEQMKEQISFYELKELRVSTSDTAKDDLMKKILSSGDVKMLEKHRKSLTEEEQQLIRSKFNL